MTPYPADGGQALTTDLTGELMAQLDPASFLQRVVAEVCVRFPAADGAALSLCDDNDCFVIVAASGTLLPRLGVVIPVERTFQVRALRSGHPEIVRSVADDPRLTPEMRMLGAGLALSSCLAIPLTSDGQRLGVLTLVSRSANAFSDSEIRHVMSASGLVSAMVNANTSQARLLRELTETPDHDSVAAARFVAAVLSPETATRERERDAIDKVIADGLLSIVLQPIVDLRNRDVVGFEALSRLPDNPFPGTESWFAAAYRVGRGVDLEMHALTRALAVAEQVPTRFPISVNLSPTAALQQVVQHRLLNTRRTLILELTEHQPAPDTVRAALQPLREHGIRLAVDDAGAGFSGLTQILALAPDLIKFDSELTRNIATDPARRALATALVQFARDIGARIVAEGIECESQYEVLRTLGIHYGQGYLIGRPAPLDVTLDRLGTGKL